MILGPSLNNALQSGTGDGGSVDIAALVAAIRADNERVGGMLELLHRFRGLDAANPVEITPSMEVAGDVSLAVSGNGKSSSTLTRV